MLSSMCMCLGAKPGPEDWAGGSRTRSSQFPEEWSPQGREAPPHESGSAPPSVSAASWSWGRGYGPARASEDSIGAETTAALGGVGGTLVWGWLRL